MSLQNIDLREEQLSTKSRVLGSTMSNEQKQETEKKQYLEYNPKIIDIINIFRTKEKVAGVEGSASFKFNKYYSDVDLFLFMNNDINPSNFYKYLSRRVLKQILDNPNYYFIEMKLQTLKGDKFRWFYKDKFDENDFVEKFKDVDFIIIDMTAFIDNKFIPVSCVYSFGKDFETKFNEKKIIKELIIDAEAYYDEKNYIKYIKRLSSVANITNNRKFIDKVQPFLNGKAGKLYQDYNNIEALQVVDKYYKDDKLLNKKIEVNLKDLKINPPTLSNAINQNEKIKEEYQNLSKEFIDNNKEIFNSITK